MPKNQGVIKIVVFLFLLTSVTLFSPKKAYADNKCGINMDPANPGGFPTPQSIPNAGWVRMEFKDCTIGNDITTNTKLKTTLEAYSSLLSTYKSAGIKTLLIIDYASYANAQNDIAGFGERAGVIATNLGGFVDAYEIWNEPDIAQGGNISPTDFATILTSAASNIGDGPFIVSGGLASGDASYLSSTVIAMGGNWGLIDAVGLHPYGKIPGSGQCSIGNTGDLATYINQHLASSGGKSIWITEIGLGTTDEVKQAMYLDCFYSYTRNKTGITNTLWFGWSDNMVSPFGLMRGDMSAKPAVQKYNDQCGSSIPQTGSNLSPITVQADGGVNCTTTGGQGKLPPTTTPINGQCPAGYSLLRQPGTGTATPPPDNNIGNSPIVPYCGVNYYPTYHTWQRMWTEWSPNEIRTELGYAKELGINMVRTFVHYDTFGQGSPNSTMINRLKEFVNIAGSLNIKSVISLFDGEPQMACNYKGDGSATSLAYENQARAIVQALDSNPNLLWWDVTNEPDTRNCADGLDNALKMSGFIKSISSKEITLGLADWGNYRKVADSPYIDIIQFHSYWDPDDIKKAILDIAANTTKKIFVGEFGLPYGRTAPWGPYSYKSGLDENDQIDYYNKVYENVLDDFRTYNSTVYSRIIGVAPWMLMEIEGSPDGEWGLIGRELVVNWPGIIYAQKYCGVTNLPPGNRLVSATPGTDICVLNSFGNATCEQPLIANPEEGCFTCTFDQTTLASEERKNDLFSNFCHLLGLDTLCSSFFDIGAALSWNAVLDVTKLTSPVEDEMFTNWYETMLPVTLPPDLAKDALDNEELALNTPSRVQIRGEQISGGGDIQIQSGEGAIFNAVGQQFASAVMDCLFTGTPDDPGCKTVQPTIASQMEYLASLPNQTTTAENILPKSGGASTKESVPLDTLIASALWGKSSTELNNLNSKLRALLPENTTESEGEVLAASAVCPEKKETLVKDPCLKQISGKEAKSTGTNKKEERNCVEVTKCTPAPTAADPGGQDCQTTKVCEPTLALTNMVAIHPDYDFVTGSVGSQKAAFPANNHTFTSIFSLPGEENGNLYPVIKKGYDSKVDFAVQRGSSPLTRIPVLGDIIEAIAHFFVQFNQEEGANVPSGGERACREERTFNAALVPPGEARDVSDECVEQMRLIPPTDWGDFPLTCGTGVLDWTNTNTTPLSGASLSSFGPMVGKIQGKIILTDGATKLLYGKDVPMNPGQILANRCGYGPGHITLHRVELGSTDWSNETGYVMSDYSGLNHIRFDLNVPPGIYAFQGDTGCWHYLNQNLPPINEAIVVENNTPQCFILKENSNMPGGYSSDLGNPDNIVNYCGINYDTAYNSMCGGLDPGQVGNTCTKPAARCGFLRTIPGWPPGNGCSEMFPSTFQIVSCSSITEPPVTLAGLNISDISCTSENICFAAAHTLAPSGVENRAFLGSTTDGINWTFKRASYTEGTETANLEIIPRIKFINNTTGWLVAKSEGAVRNVILKTTDGGNTWTRQASEGLDTKNYQSFDMLTDSLGVVGPSSGIADAGILYTTNGGEGERCSWDATKWCPTWSKQNITSSIGDTNTFNSALDTSFYSADNVMIAANGHRMYKVSNTGTGWDLTGGRVTNCDGNGSLGANMERVRMLSDSLGYAAGNRCVAKYEGGVWAKLSGFDAVSYRGLDVATGAQIFAAENGAVYILHSGGTPTKIVLPNAGKLLSVEIIGNTVYVGGDRGKIYISRDLGITWEEQKSIVLQGQ